MFEIVEDPTVTEKKRTVTDMFTEEFLKGDIVKLEEELKAVKSVFAHKEKEYQARIGELNLELLTAKKESKPVQALRKTVLKADEVCGIILHSGKANVSELTFGDLHVRFGAPKSERQPEELSLVGQSQPTAPTSSETILSDEEAARITKDTLEIQELLTREQQMAELQLTDPVEYERQLAAGELEDAPRATEDT